MHKTEARVHFNATETRNICVSKVDYKVKVATRLAGDARENKRDGDYVCQTAMNGITYRHGQWVVLKSLSSV